MNSILAQQKILPTFQDDKDKLIGSSSSSQKRESTERYVQTHLCDIQVTFKEYMNFMTCFMIKRKLSVSLNKKLFCNSKTQRYILLGLWCVKRTHWFLRFKGINF
jgi:hypothetical protein